MKLDTERVSVQAAAFMVGRKIRQPVRGFDGEGLEDFHLRYGCVKSSYSNELVRLTKVNPNCDIDTG